EPAVVEIDHAQAVAVDQEVGEPEVRVNEAETFGAFAVGGQLARERVARALENGSSVRREAKRVAPVSPQRRGAQHGVEVPCLAAEALGPLPGACVTMQAGADPS